MFQGVIRTSCFVLLLTVPAIAQVSSSPGTISDPDSTSSVSLQAADASQDRIQAQQTAKETPAEPEAHGTRLRWQDIPKNILYDQKAIWTSPFRINRDNAKWWLGFGAGTAVLVGTVDRRLSDRMPNSSKMIRVSKWSSQLGADYTIFPLFATFYLVGKVGDNPRARDASRISIEALGDSEIVLNTLKFVTQRPRPEQRGMSVAFWSGGDAFPSGHATKSWAVARVIAREFPHPRIIPILAYGLAGTVSVTRIGGRRHSPSDALAGSAIGFFIGDFVYRHHHAPSQESTVH